MPTATRQAVAGARHSLAVFCPPWVYRLRRLRAGYSAGLADSKKAGKSLQQYITRCYGSLTTFNILFKNKDDQFRTSAVDRPNS